MRHKYTKEILEDAVRKCTSWRQLILYFSLKETGGNYKNLQKKCEEFDTNLQVRQLYKKFSFRGLLFLVHTLEFPFDKK